MKSKTMNYLSIGLMCLFLTIGSISSCIDAKEEDHNTKSDVAVNNPNLPVGEKVNVASRIKVSNYVDGSIAAYEIVEIDGQEYLSSSRGGLIKLEPNN